MGFMRPLSRMFRPEPAPPPVQDARVEVAVPADDLTARSGAVALQPDGASLRTLAGLSGVVAGESAVLVHAAQARMAQLIDSGAVNFAALRGEVRNADALLSVAALCSDAALLAQLLDAGDSQPIAQLVTDASSSRVRQLAAQRIVDPGELKQLLKQVRGKDKNVYRIIKQKCDELRVAEQKSLLVEGESAAACASLERHSHRIYDAVYEATFEHFAARWQPLAAQAAPAIQHNAANAIERCREIIAEHQRQVSQLAERQALLEQREAALKLQQAEQVESSNRAQEDAQRLEQAAAAALAQSRHAEGEARSAKLAAEAGVVRRLSGLVAKTHGALRDGDTGRAAGLRRAIDEGLAAIAAQPVHLSRQIQQLDAKLNELKQWKDFAVAPKRAELIADMEALIGSTDEPRALAERIKQLQDEWKSISKGIVSDSQADWQRFHQAAETAYQPCRAYFEAQAKIRVDNLRERETLLERLRKFEAAHSGEHADWRAIAAVLREARQEWRRRTPVERTAAAAVQEEFDAALTRLQQRLDAWYAQNIAEKRSLIERARGLTEKPDNREAVEGAKHLQQLWKNIGAVERDLEQQLWGEFREQCDVVFAKRQQAHVDHIAALDGNKAAALELCQEAERVAALSGVELIEGSARIPQWRSAFEAIGETPRAEQRALQERFERAIKLCQTRITETRVRDRLQSFTQMLEAARHVQVYGCAVAQHAAATERDAHKLAAETFIAGVQQWPKGAPQALKEAWQKADAAMDLDLAQNERALRLLCIRSEIFAEQPTPPEDQALRREHQMRRLTQRMGQGAEESAEDWETLALAWVRTGPVVPLTYQSLLARFVRCR